jgi:cysteine desulfurase
VVKPIYLDYNATTPVTEQVIEAMTPFWADYFGNPSSSHAAGRTALEAVEDARMHVAMLLGADRDEIYFTGGGTEAANLGLWGALGLLGASGSAWDGRSRLKGHIVTTAVEHPAVSAPIALLESMGFSVTRVETNPHGAVDVDAISDALRNETVLVSVMHANNETGVIQPISEIGELLSGRDIVFHTDAAQTVGKIPTQVDDLNVDLLSIAGHKLYGPKGVGALYARFGTSLQPIIRGADHEKGLRPGTENVPGIVGLGEACRQAFKLQISMAEKMEGQRNRLQGILLDSIPGLQVNGIQAVRLPNTLSVVFPNIMAHELLRIASEVQASTGSACHSGQASISPTLANLGLSLEQAQGTVRLSLGWHTSEDDVDRAASILINAWQSLTDN